MRRKLRRSCNLNDGPGAHISQGPKADSLNVILVVRIIRTWLLALRVGAMPLDGQQSSSTKTCLPDAALFSLDLQANLSRSLCLCCITSSSEAVSKYGTLRIPEKLILGILTVVDARHLRRLFEISHERKGVAASCASRHLHTTQLRLC